MTQTIEVERIETDHGSHIEPPLDESWDELTKLQWLAAVVSADSGLTVEVIEYPTNYCIHIAGPTGGTLSSSTAVGFHDTWRYLSGIATGLRIAGRTN